MRILGSQILVNPVSEVADCSIAVVEAQGYLTLGYENERDSPHQERDPSFFFFFFDR